MRITPKKKPLIRRLAPFRELDLDGPRPPAPKMVRLPLSSARSLKPKKAEKRPSVFQRLVVPIKVPYPVNVDDLKDELRYAVTVYLPSQGFCKTRVVDGYQLKHNWRDLHLNFTTWSTREEAQRVDPMLRVNRWLRVRFAVKKEALVQILPPWHRALGTGALNERMGW